MRILRITITLCLGWAVTGCGHFSYYGQAIGGHMEILASSRPITEILNDPQTAPELKKKLELVLHVRDYASRELLLPDNASYRSYTDLGRPYVLWNVFAAPDLSLKPKKWCFIMVGCVAYRGYFSRERAQALADTLRTRGYDVYVAAVSAYSTLGWFNDPMLNTMLLRSDAGIAGLVFHELAHQLLYVKGDTAFNESFAVTVEQEGVRRWLESQGAPEKFAHYRAAEERRREFVALILRYRAMLEHVYRSDLGREEKLAAKARIFRDLRRDYQTLKRGWYGYTGYDHWFAHDLNNAKIVSIGTYHRYVGAFRTLLARKHDDLGAFYRAAQALARLPAAERAAALAREAQAGSRPLAASPPAAYRFGAR